MNLETKISFFNENKKKLPRYINANYEQTFEIEFIHNSTAIEGNTLSLIQTKMIVEDNYFSGSNKLREIFEVINHKKAFDYVKKCIQNEENLNENIVKNIHEILMDNIMNGGFYRSANVFITGANHEPPSSREMYEQVKFFYYELEKNKYNDPIKLAAWVHAEFVKIHPFNDGNGRTSRLIMNYILMKKGLLPINIKNENKLEYFESLDKYASTGNLEQFCNLVKNLEELELDKYITAIKDLELEKNQNDDER